MKILLTKKLAEAVLEAAGVCIGEGIGPQGCDWNNLVTMALLVYPEDRYEYLRSYHENP
jgi:hypothetical protein